MAVLKIPYPSKDLHESLGNKLHLISQKMRLFEANLKKIKNKDRSFARTFAADLKAHVVTTLCHFNYTAMVKACRVNILIWKAKKRRSLCENRGKEDNGVDKSVNTANNDENKDVNVDNAVKNMIKILIILWMLSNKSFWQKIEKLSPSALNINDPIRSNRIINIGTWYLICLLAHDVKRATMEILEIDSNKKGLASYFFILIVSA